MTRSLAALACVLSLAGCGRYEKAPDLQQQKLVVDLMKTDNERRAVDERLAAAAQREDDLREREKKNLETLHQLEQKHAALQAREEVAQRERAVTDQASNLKAEQEKIRLEKEKLRTDSEAVQALKSKMEALAAAFKAKEALERGRMHVVERLAQAVSDLLRTHGIDPPGISCDYRQVTAEEEQAESRKLQFYHNDFVNEVQKRGFFEAASETEFKEEAVDFAEWYIHAKFKPRHRMVEEDKLRRFKARLSRSSEFKDVVSSIRTSRSADSADARLLVSQRP
jgi:DNA repair exonuclease SbcCD ATPase subunit